MRSHNFGSRFPLGTLRPSLQIFVLTVQKSRSLVLELCKTVKTLKSSVQTVDGHEKNDSKQKLCFLSENPVYQLINQPTKVCNSTTFFKNPNCT